MQAIEACGVETQPQAIGRKISNEDNKRKVTAMFVHVNGIEIRVKNAANAIYLFVMTMQKQLLFVQIVFFNLLN